MANSVGQKTKLFRAFWAFVPIFVCFAPFVFAERLPTKIYTIADGLSRDTVTCVRQDTRGFIWFCTPEGLSRFDGYEFKNYPKEYGLPDRYVNDFLETRGGKIWVGTGNGLALFNPKGQPATLFPNSAEPMFTVFSLPVGTNSRKYITKLFEDSRGTVWIGSDQGLCALDEENGETKIRAIDLGASPSGEFHYVFAIFEDTEKNLWIGTNNLLFKRKPDGSLEKFGKENGFPEGIVNDPATKYPFHSVAQDADGRFWVGTAFGVTRLVQNPQVGQNIVERIYTKQDGLADLRTMQFLLSKDGKFWVAMPRGVSEYQPDENAFCSFTEDNGLIENGTVNVLTEDAEGNLWVGENGGAVKVARSGFTTFRKTDGLTFVSSSIFEDKAGEIYSISDHLGEGREPPIFRFENGKFKGVKIKALEKLKNYGWGTHKTAFQDREGEWWFPTGVGLYRFPKVEKIEDLANLKPKRIYTKKDGLPNEEIFRLFEDSRGDIWISSMYAQPSLSRWSRAKDTIETFAFDDDKDFGTPMSYAEDRSGNLWMGSYSGRLFRYRDGQFTRFYEKDGLPPGYLMMLYVDGKNRLWGSTTRGGVYRIDDVNAEKPHFAVITTADGLPSNAASVITEDLHGRMYFATGRGIARYEPETGKTRHFTTADGLGANHFTDAKRDRQGNLWFATSNGISRLDPKPEPPVRSPPIYISSLRLGDENFPVSEAGETEISNLELSPDLNRIEIVFVSPNFSGSGNLRYQYQLEGADNDWREIGRQRTLNFASLSPGNYRFLVRAVNADGAASENPARVSFRVLRPVWQRWWFLTIVAVLIGSAIYALYRYRVAQIIKLERVRTRIATDLHDDIGSSLSQIAILSEVVRQKVGGNGASEPLNLIADTSREMVDSMSDIVWAINPNKDHLSDLVQRMRRFASDVLEASDIAYRFEAPESVRDIALGADVRREVYLMFKEAVNNLVKYSAASEAGIKIKIENGFLLVCVEDDGKGFDVETVASGFGGNGLPNMRKRAANLSGKFEVASSHGKGTRVQFSVPLKHRAN